MDREGRGLPGHPFCPDDTDLSHICTKAYAKGFRNPFRFSLRSDGTPVVGDVGWTATEEVDVVRRGRNYGWPCYEGPFRTTTVQDDSRCAGQYAAEGTANAAFGPIHSYPHANGGSSVTGGPVYEATAFPAEFRGDVFFADYVKGFIKRLELDGSDQLTAVRDFASGGGGIVDLQVTPGGALAYVDINGGAVRQIRYVSSANRPPIAQASADPTAGPLPLAVNLRGVGSSDPDGDTLRFQWDFGDGTPGSTARDPSHTYSTAGRFTARLTVTDGRGGSDSQTVTIDAGNRPPSVTLNAPPTYRAGQQVTVSGSAVDPEDGQLPDSALEWDIRLIHIDHEHEADDPVGVGSTTFTAADGPRRRLALRGHAHRQGFGRRDRLEDSHDAPRDHRVDARQLTERRSAQLHRQAGHGARHAPRGDRVRRLGVGRRKLLEGRPQLQVRGLVRRWNQSPRADRSRRRHQAGGPL